MPASPSEKKATWDRDGKLKYRTSLLLEPDPHKAILCSARIYDQLCAVFRNVTQVFKARAGTILLQLRPFPDFASKEVETTLMPAADQAEISSDRALRVREVQRFGLSGASAFIERQMKMRAGIVESAIAVRPTNDDDIVIFEIENPALVGLKPCSAKARTHLLPPSQMVSRSPLAFNSASISGFSLIISNRLVRSPVPRRRTLIGGHVNIDLVR